MLAKGNILSYKYEPSRKVNVVREGVEANSTNMQSTAQSATQNVTVNVMPDGPVYPTVGPQSGHDIVGVGVGPSTFEPPENDELKILNKVIDIYLKNPLLINKVVIASITDLCELIKLMTGASDIEIEYSDPECGCNGTPIDCYYPQKIYCTVGGERTNFKYAFSNIYARIETYNISLRVVKVVD